MRHLTLAAIIGVALAGATLAGGCVSQDKYQTALAASRRANLQLEETQEALRSCRKENQDLANQLTNTDASVGARAKEIRLLEKQNADLRRRFEELSEMVARQGADTVPTLPPFDLPEQVDEALREF